MKRFLGADWFTDLHIGGTPPIEGGITMDDGIRVTFDIGEEFTKVQIHRGDRLFWQGITRGSARRASFDVIDDD